MGSSLLTATRLRCTQPIHSGFELGENPTSETFDSGKARESERTAYKGRARQTNPQLNRPGKMGLCALKTPRDEHLDREKEAIKSLGLTMDRLDLFEKNHNEHNGLNVVNSQT